VSLFTAVLLFIPLLVDELRHMWGNGRTRSEFTRRFVDYILLSLSARPVCHGDIAQVRRKDVQGASGCVDGQVGKIVGLMLSFSTSSY